MRSAIEGINLSRRGPLPPLSWPSKYRCFGVWGYALGRAFDEARERGQKVYVWKGVIDGDPVWITSLDPKRPLAARAGHGEENENG